jgi:hypothetical protein
VLLGLLCCWVCCAVGSVVLRVVLLHAPLTKKSIGGL